MAEGWRVKTENRKPKTENRKLDWLRGEGGGVENRKPKTENWIGWRGRGGGRKPKTENGTKSNKVDVTPKIDYQV